MHHASTIPDSASTTHYTVHIAGMRAGMFWNWLAEVMSSPELGVKYKIIYCFSLLKLPEMSHVTSNVTVIYFWQEKQNLYYLL